MNEGVNALVIPMWKLSEQQMERIPNENDIPLFRDRLTEAVQELLLNLEAPREVFRPKMEAMLSASSGLGVVLLRAVPHVSPELGEAYTAEGNSCPDRGVFLMYQAIEFRRRKGINDKTDIEGLS